MKITVTEKTVKTEIEASSEELRQSRSASDCLTDLIRHSFSKSMAPNVYEEDTADEEEEEETDE